MYYYYYQSQYWEFIDAKEWGSEYMAKITRLTLWRHNLLQTLKPGGASLVLNEMHLTLLKVKLSKSQNYVPTVC